MRITLPQRSSIKQTTAADPLKFYYWPMARRFYLARFKDCLRLLGGRVGDLLEVGCGSGIFLPELAKHCDRLSACDTHANMDHVREMLKLEGVKAEVARGDAANLPYPSGSMDAIVCMSVLEHIRDLQPCAEEFFRVLKPGGVAVIGVPVSNIVSEAMLRMSYLTISDAKLEDEHVSTDRQVFAAFDKKFTREKGKVIPRLLPRFVRLYSTARFRKP